MYIGFRTARSVSQDKACSMAELSMLPCSKNASGCVSLLPESKSPFTAERCTISYITQNLGNDQNCYASIIKKTFTPFGVPRCKPEATLVPETGVAAAKHIYSFQAKPVPT